MMTVAQWLGRMWWPSVKRDANRIKITLRRGGRRITATLELAEAEEFYHELALVLDEAEELHDIMYSRKDG